MKLLNKCSGSPPEVSIITLDKGELVDNMVMVAWEENFFKACEGAVGGC